MLEFLYTLGQASGAAIAISLVGVVLAGLAALRTSQGSQNKTAVEQKAAKKKIRIYNSICYFFIALATVFAINFFVMQGYCKVPNVVSLSKSEAVSRLFDVDLDVVMPSNVDSDERVLKQDPEKRTIVPKYFEVTLEFEPKVTEQQEPTTPTEDPTEPKETEAPTTPSAQRPQIGDTVFFGTYQQNSHSADPVEWKVLDVQGNKALLLSSQGLDCLPYNDSYTQTTWATSTLRTWLNTTFLNTAFTRSEQNAIVETTVDNSVAQGNSAWSKKGSANTTDKVFLLSYVEANQYLKTTADRICTATEYAISHNADTRLMDDGISYAFWWLRSQGEKNSHAAYINFEGNCYSNAVGNNYLSVRPALWVDCEAADLTDSSK